jgi:hypothetical protein
VDIVAEAAKLQEAMIRRTQRAQQARAPESKGDAGQGGSVTAAQTDTEGEVGQGGANDATRPDIEVEAGWGDADSGARLVAGEGTGRDTLERPASQTEVETLILKPPRAGVEGITEEESAPGALAMEETCVPGPAGARDEGVVVALMA